ncbi:MAG: ABC transporter ATP-binding protein [Chloroflexi bacterium]|nr:ABC transporter ATP-binding protein [Chloroflexota bacterium]
MTRIQTPSIALSAQHVQKRYGQYQALLDASLDVRAGEIMALLGPNGAGKTTLIKILVTLISKDAGKVEILGHDLDRDPESIRHLIGYVGQDTERSAYARLTVWENLNFFGALRGMTAHEIRSQVDKLATFFDFNGQMDKQFVTLSGGQKQTVVIMRALLHDPPLVCLDEPTKGLDPLIARRIRAFLKRFVREQGKSLLLTSEGCTRHAPVRRVGERRPATGDHRAHPGARTSALQPGKGSGLDFVRRRRRAAWR